MIDSSLTGRIPVVEAAAEAAAAAAIGLWPTFQEWWDGASYEGTIHSTGGVARAASEGVEGEERAAEERVRRFATAVKAVVSSSRPS